MFKVFDIPPPDPVRLPLTTSPWPVFLILSSYLCFVLKLGKLYMANRQPYNLRNILVVYNLGQVAYNGIFFVVTFYYLIISPICDFRCMETFPLDHKHKNLERWVHYAYFVNKIIDLLDTVFFVLRKSYKQVSFLHVYHHVMMVTGCYLVMRFYGTGGHFNIVGMLNSFVHTVMYFYYFLSAFDSGVKRSLWWKKYITITQIVQFLILFVCAAQVLVFNPSCGFPRILLAVQILQAVILIYMFSRFYVQNYLRPVRPKAA